MSEMTCSGKKSCGRGSALSACCRRPMTLGVRAIALDAAGRVFLVRHTYMPGFYLPGGGVERGETALTSLERELAEEGRIALGEPPRLIGFFYNPRHSRRDHVALYLAKNVRQTRSPCRPTGRSPSRGFFPLDALPPETTPSTRARHRRIFAAARRRHQSGDVATTCAGKSMTECNCGGERERRNSNARSMRTSGCSARFSAIPCASRKARRFSTASRPSAGCRSPASARPIRRRGASSTPCWKA